MSQVMFEVILPKNDNFIAALFEVFKLGLVPLYVLLLNIGQLFNRKPMRIPVPEIAKSLNYHIVIGQKFINHEFTSYLILRMMSYAYLIQHVRQKGFYIRALGHPFGQKLKLGLSNTFLGALWHYIAIGGVIFSIVTIPGVIAASKALFVGFLKVRIGALHSNPVALQKSFGLAPVHISKHPTPTLAGCPLLRLMTIAISAKAVGLMLRIGFAAPNTGIVFFTPSGWYKLLSIASLTQPLRVMGALVALATLTASKVFVPHTDIIPLHLYKCKDNQ